MSPLACAGCTACCERDAVMLTQDDLPRMHLYRWHHESAVEHIPLATKGAVRVLDRKPDGSCVYLTPTGCGIHADRPARCRQFDCRDYVGRFSEAEHARRITLNPTLAAVLAAGRQRLGA